MLSQEGPATLAAQDGEGATQCGCGGARAPLSAKEENESPPAVTEPNLEDVLLLAIVIAAGCETCAEKTVARALEHGSAGRHLQKTLQIIAKIRKLDCFAQAVGAEVVARMEKPLAAGRRTLREAMVSEGW